MRVAVMQPYFYPYMGYFQLIASVDLFVIFDCVQFPRRGRVHRAPVPEAGQDAPGQASGWLTLPLARQPRDTAIRDLALAADRDARWAEARARLPWLRGPVARALAAPLPDMVLPLLEEHLALAMERLGIAVPMLRSSSLGLPADLRAQDRVIAAARAAGGTAYVNLPGGRDLYDPQAFAAHGLELEFIAPYTGPHFSMLHALIHADDATLRADLATGVRPRTTGVAP